jgi:hypothetical protein
MATQYIHNLIILKELYLLYYYLFYAYKQCSKLYYSNFRQRINATEMDALRRSAMISKLDRKTNEYIRGKMEAQYMILDDITRKQLIWYGHVERIRLNMLF